MKKENTVQILEEMNLKFCDKLQKFFEKNKIDSKISVRQNMYVHRRDKDDDYKQEISMKEYPYRSAYYIQYWLIDLKWFNKIHEMICDYLKPFYVKFRTSHSMGQNFVEYHIYITEKIIENPRNLNRERKLNRIINNNK